MNCSIGNFKLNYHAGKNRSVAKIDIGELTLKGVEKNKDYSCYDKDWYFCELCFS